MAKKSQSVETDDLDDLINSEFSEMTDLSKDDDSIQIGRASCRERV